MHHDQGPAQGEGPSAGSLDLVFQRQHRLVARQHQGRIDPSQHAHHCHEEEQEKQQQAIAERAKRQLQEEQGIGLRQNQVGEPGRRQRSQNGKQARLCQELAHQLGPVGPQYLPHPHLPGALHRLRRGQVDEVDAGDEQDKQPNKDNAADVYFGYGPPVIVAEPLVEVHFAQGLQQVGAPAGLQLAHVFCLKGRELGLQAGRVGAPAEQHEVPGSPGNADPIGLVLPARIMNFERGPGDEKMER